MKQSKNEINLGEGSVGRLLLTLAVPSVIAQLVNLLYNLVDRIYIGHIPENGGVALTGLGLCFPILMIVTAFSGLIGYGGAPRVAIFMGKGKNDEAEEILGNCTMALIVIALILVVVLQFAAEPLLMLFGASDNTLPYALSYLNIYGKGTLEIRVRELGRKISMERIHPHKFRRTMATRAIDKGMPIEQVQKILGHSQIDTTMQYAIVNQNNVKTSHRKYIA